MMENHIINGYIINPYEIRLMAIPYQIGKKWDFRPFVEGCPPP